MDGPQGFDQSQGLWEARGWAQVEELRKKLERLTELRELVRSLGRAGGRGPKRRAPEEVRTAKKFRPASAFRQGAGFNASGLSEGTGFL